MDGSTSSTSSSMTSSSLQGATSSGVAGGDTLLVALDELACLVDQLGTMVTPLFTEASGIMEPVFAVLLHPVYQVKLSGAWCLRAISSAVPSLASPLIDRCLSRLDHLKSSPDALTGYSLALSAVMAGSYRCPLGIPSSKGRHVFQVAEELLRTAAQTSRLTLAKTQAGWALFAGLMTLGPGVVTPHLPKILLLWRNAFPRSAKEAEGERLRGDGFTWQVTLESRSGALVAMASFLTHCSGLVTDDVIRRLLVPIEAGLTMFTHMPSIIADNGSHLRPLAAMARMRLYSTLSALKPSSFDTCFSALLRELAAEFTLTDRPGHTVTSLLSSMCHADERVILGESYADADQSWLEASLEDVTLANGSHFGTGEPPVGALENDPYVALLSRPEDAEVTGPVSPAHLSIGVLDSGITLYGMIFPLVPGKHRLQILDHFQDCIRQAKGVRQTAIQVNVLTAFLCSLRHQAEGKVGFDSDAVRTSAINLIVGCLSSNLSALRCAAAEALGRVAQVVGDPHFVASLAQSSFDRLKSCRDVVNRTGFSLALGCLHRYVGGLGSAHHLSTSISVLTALYHDVSSPEVQLWAIHAVALIADSGGPMFRGYVDPSLAVSLKLLLTAPVSLVDVHRCICRLISSLITCVGPELQSNMGNIVTTRNNFLAACAILSTHTDPIVVAESVYCLQQLHIFSPRHVNMGQLVPELCRMLKSPHVTIKKAATDCMRQLAQKEAEELHEHAQSLVPKGLQKSASSKALAGKGGRSWGVTETSSDDVLPESGLEGALFKLLDTETDAKLRENIQETLLSLCQRLCSANVYHWLNLCKQILATVSTDLHSLHAEEKVVRITESITEDDGVDEDESLSGMGALGGGRDKGGKEGGSGTPRWPTRVFAMDLVQKIMVFCSSQRAHFDLALAKELQMGGSGAASTPAGTALPPSFPNPAGLGAPDSISISSGGGYHSGQMDFLVLHLSDLVRVAFMAATSDTVQLRLSGLATLQDVIHRFAAVPEPEFPGHVVLEQFQAQVGAALRPAFSPDTPSNVTAAACEVCSTWIGSGVARDLNDLRRVHQLLVSSLAKIKTTDDAADTAQIYSESAAALERLAVLRAWAEVYIVAKRQASKSDNAAAKNSTENGGASANGGGRNGSLEPPLDPEMGGSEMTKSDTLLQLVQPELGVLVIQWLQALQDLALTSLPPEVRVHAPAGRQISQLSPEALKSLPAILLAAATWLQSTNFSSASEQELKAADARAEIGSMRPGHKISSDRLYLMLGICIEALCNPKVTDDLEIQQYLESLQTVLDCDYSRDELLADPQVLVEILNVMHRIILTSSSLRFQRLCVQVLEKVLDTLAYAAGTHRSSTNNIVSNNNDDDPEGRLKSSGNVTSVNGVTKKEKLSTSNSGPPPDVHSMTPGKSVIFAALEVCLCTLVRQIPDLYPSAQRLKRPSGSKLPIPKPQPVLTADGTPSTITGSSAQTSSHNPVHINSHVVVMSSEAQNLVISALGALGRIPGVCGRSTDTLPIVMFLLTATIRYTSKVPLPPKDASPGGPPAGSSTIGQVSPVTAAGLQTLKALVSRPLLKRDESISTRNEPSAGPTSNGSSSKNNTPASGAERILDSNWVHILRSTLLTILEWRDAPEMDPVITILSVAVFLISCPSAVTFDPPNIRKAEIELFAKCLASPHLMVRYKSLQSLQSVFMLKDREKVLCFFHGVGGAIFGMLKSMPTGEPGAVRGDFEDSHALLIPEGLKCLEILLGSGFLDSNQQVFLLVYALEIALDLIEWNPRRASEEKDGKAKKSEDENDSEDAAPMDSGDEENMESIPANSSLVTAPSPARRKIHDALIARLHRWSGEHRATFATALAASPTLKPRLERALKMTSSTTNASQNPAVGSGSGTGSRGFGKPRGDVSAAAAGGGHSAAMSGEAANPAIKLTMDFSQFAAK